MGSSFSQAEVFPLIARIIVQATAGRDEFVDNRTIVSLLLNDAKGMRIVRRAIASSTFPDPKTAARNMVSWFSQKISVNNSPWESFFDRVRRSNGWAYRPVFLANQTLIGQSDYAAIEGNPIIYFHFRRERDQEIVKAKRDSFIAEHGKLFCESCQFSTSSIYAGLNSDICEIHHRLPLAFANKPVNTRLNDLAVLCPNCHRAIHKTVPLMSIEEFRLKYCGSVPKGSIGKRRVSHT
jgi:hypothetical protein